MSRETTEVHDPLSAPSIVTSTATGRSGNKSLIEVLSAIVAVGDVDAMLPIAARGVQEQFGFTAVLIGVIERRGVRLAGLYPEPHAKERRVPLDLSLFRQMPAQAGIVNPARSAREYELLGIDPDDGHLALIAPIAMPGDASAGIAVLGSPDEISGVQIREQLAILSIFIGARFHAAAQVASERNHLDRLIRLQNLTARIIRHDNLVDVDKDILEDIASVFDYTEVRIGLAHGDEIHLFRTYRDAAKRQNPSERLSSDTGFAAQVLRSGAPRFIDGPDQHNELPATLRDGVRQTICVPLRVNGDVAGVLCAMIDERRTLVVDDLGILIMLAESIGLVLANFRRLYEVERRNHQLRLVDSLVSMIAARTMIQRAIPEVVREIANRFAFQLVGIGLIKHDRLNFTLASINVPTPPLQSYASGIPIDRGISGRVARTGHPEFITDVRRDPDYIDAGWDTRSEICVPIRSSGSVIGVLNVESGDEQPLDEADLEILQIIARHLGIAFENEALLISERAARRAVEALQQVSTIVTSTLNVDEALRRIVDTLGSFFDYRYVVAGLLEGGFVVPSAAHGIALERLVPMPIGLAPAGKVAQTGERMFISNVRTDPSVHLPTFPDATSLLVVPITREGEVLGVLDVIGTVDRPVGMRDAQLLETFAQHAGIVLENAMMYEEARRMALVDPMTQLPNRRRFEQAFEAELSRARVHGSPFAVLVMDLDGFKSVNDRFGHLEGDAVLTAVGQRLARHLREQDELARYAGDEFVALLTGADAPTAMAIAERLRAAIDNEPFSTESGDRASITISAGVSVYPDHGSTMRDLLSAADNASYDAKNHGRNEIRMAPPRLQH